MREILFRGKRCDNGEWIKGLPIRTYDTEIGKSSVDYENPAPVELMASGRIVLECGYDEIPFFNIDEYPIVKPETVGQYTGLKDKNGTRIFEGDVVKLFDIAIGEIVCECGAFGISCRQQIDYDYLASEIASVTGCDNKPRFCRNDNFVSLWELYWNYNQESSEISVIEVIGNVHDGGAYD